MLKYPKRLPASALTWHGRLSVWYELWVKYSNMVSVYLFMSYCNHYVFTFGFFNSLLESEWWMCWFIGLSLHCTHRYTLLAESEQPTSTGQQQHQLINCNLSTLKSPIDNTQVTWSDSKDSQSPFFCWTGNRKDWESF